MGPNPGQGPHAPPVRRPIEVAGYALFLPSDDAPFIPATDLGVDGGCMGIGAEGLREPTNLTGSK